MDEDNSTRLAKTYSKKHQQILVLFPYVWKHYPNGNWFCIKVFPEEYR